MDVLAIKDELKTILDGLTGTLAADLFSVAYDYPEGKPASFPAARVYLLGGGTQEIMEYNSVYQTVDFVIDVLFEYVASKAEYDTMLDIFKDLTIELNKQSNYTLSGNVEYVLAEDFEFFYPNEMDSSKYMGFSILVQVKKLQATEA